MLRTCVFTHDADNDSQYYNSSDALLGQPGGRWVVKGFSPISTRLLLKARGRKDNIIDTRLAAGTATLEN